MVVREDCAYVQYSENAARQSKGVLLLVVVGDYDTSNNSGNDSQQENEKTETDPSLLASSSSRHDRLVCVFDTEGDDVNNAKGNITWM